MMRRALLAAALIILWVLALGTAVGIPWSAPLFPRDRIVLPGQGFHPVIGAGIEDGSALSVGANANDGNALQSIAIDKLRAADLPVLTYRFEDFPRTLEVLLVFRRADAPDDVQSVLLPWPGAGSATVDVRHLTDAWRGEIIEIGFAEYATAQLVPPSVAFRPFRLERLQLASPAWNELPRLLWSNWFGYEPWSQSSINAVGSALGDNASMPLVLVIAALLTLAIVALFLGVAPRRLAAGALVAGAAIWVTLDLRWLDQLFARHGLAQTLYSGKSWQERARLQPDENVAAYADLARQQLRDVSAQRVLAASDSTYTLLRLIYFLLPANVVPLESALATTPVDAWPADLLIVLCVSKQWRYDESDASLHRGTQKVPATPVFIGSDVRIYRFRGGGK
jgi:hypothetical protein